MLSRVQKNDSSPPVRTSINLRNWCAITTHHLTDWLPVLNKMRDVVINYDLQNVPLKIKTDSELGSGEQMSVRFMDSRRNDAGGIIIHFNNALRYELISCTSGERNFPREIRLCAAAERIWTIELKVFPKSYTSDVSYWGKGLIVHCNNVEVLNVRLDFLCDIGNNWSRKVDKIKFLHSDTASDYFRSSAGNYNCNTMNVALKEFTAASPGGKLKSNKF